jgi:tRNA (guanine37-N1)-methyltransferase
MIKIDVITIFPNIFDNFTNFGVIKEGINKKLCELTIYNLREFTEDKHKKVDDRPYGGGAGMVFMVQPIDSAVRHIKKKNDVLKINLQKTILLTPGGDKLKQNTLKYLSGMENLILICGRYEGVDERIKDLVVDMEISIGDFILTGGEIPAMVLIDGVIRLLEGVVGKEESLKNESFENDLLDYPQYTRPDLYKGLKVPDVLISGNHSKIKKWREEKSVEITKKKRPDLFDKNH